MIQSHVTLFKIVVLLNVVGSIERD